MFYNFYYLGSKVEEKLESIIESRQMKMDIRISFARLPTANLEAYHSLIDHFDSFLTRGCRVGKNKHNLLSE